MYFSSFYRRGVRFKNEDVPSAIDIFEVPFVSRKSRKLVSFLHDTNLAMIGRGFSLFLLFCPSRCTLCMSLSWRSISSSSAILNKTFSPIIVVFFIFSYCLNKNIFSYVLFLSVKLKNNQICFLNHLIALLYFLCFKLIQLIFMFNHLFLYSS